MCTIKKTRATMANQRLRYHVERTKTEQCLLSSSFFSGLLTTSVPIKGSLAVSPPTDKTLFTAHYLTVFSGSYRDKAQPSEHYLKTEVFLLDLYRTPFHSCLVVISLFVQNVDQNGKQFGCLFLFMTSQNIENLFRGVSDKEGW